MRAFFLFLLRPSYISPRHSGIQGGPRTLASKLDNLLHKYGDCDFFCDIFSEPSNQSNFRCFDLVQFAMRLMVKSLRNGSLDSLTLAVRGLEILTRNGMIG